MNAVAKGVDIGKILKDSIELPTMPAVAQQLLSISEWENIDLRKVAEIISKDVSLSSKILQVVNSPHYGFAHEISTISQALVVLGVRATRSIALSFTLLRMYPRNRVTQFDYLGFWTRSLNTAVAARELALVAGLRNQEEAFIAGLLQDIGVMMIAHCAPEKYARIFSKGSDKLAPSVEKERKHLGIDHVEVAKTLFDKWNLPVSLRIPILYHHAPEKATNVDEQRLLAIRIQYFAGKIGDWLYNIDEHKDRLKELEEFASRYLGISSTELKALLYRVDISLEEMSKLFEQITSRPNTYKNLLEEATLALSGIVSEQEHLLRELEAAKADARKLAEQLRLANNKLLDDALKDPLTDLPNRRLFQDCFEKELQRSMRYKHPIALLFIDIDDFKSVNDRHGHLQGDYALRQLANILKHELRTSDIIARFGGEEFLVALAETNAADAEKTAERIRSLVADTPIFLGDDGSLISLTVSIGGVAWEFPDIPLEIDTLIQRADHAMYQAKKSGKNCVSIWHKQEESQRI